MRGRTPVPPAGDERRVWITYELAMLQNPKTGRRYSQSDVAREAFVSLPTVSLVYRGDRENGLKAEKVQRITARILGMTTEELFGVALPAGDGYAGSEGVST